MEKISKILIVSSTEYEISEFQELINTCRKIRPDLNTCKFGDIEIDILISGIGIPQMIYNLSSQLFRNKYDFVINAGICGSYNEDLIIGDSVSIILDEFADIGINDKDNFFSTLFEEKLLKPNTKPFKNGKLYNPFKKHIDTGLPKVTAITVNSVSGNEDQIKMRQEKFNPDIESMEGAAFAYVCLTENVNFLQIRTVSNKVEPRNKENWNIPLAVKNLSQDLISILEKLNND